ncbi:MAG: hypothetical protein A3E80_04570 [Chlamydiae bacterium RIFCSPHIGHO2_12_FULL_49_9]|nr:MAG: hypothetical protein A3E80_04570 [Chlamydiae bacterium RIFCSPHIGHO2_12_FULL_49_9]
MRFIFASKRLHKDPDEGVEEGKKGQKDSLHEKNSPFFPGKRSHFKRIEIDSLKGLVEPLCSFVKRGDDKFFYPVCSDWAEECHGFRLFFAVSCVYYLPLMNF